MVERFECAIVERESLLEEVGMEVESRGGLVCCSSMELLWMIGNLTQP